MVQRSSPNNRPARPSERSFCFSDERNPTALLRVTSPIIHWPKHKPRAQFNGANIVAGRGGGEHERKKRRRRSVGVVRLAADWPGRNLRSPSPTAFLPRTNNTALSTSLPSFLSPYLRMCPEHGRARYPGWLSRPVPGSVGSFELVCGQHRATSRPTGSPYRGLPKTP